MYTSELLICFMDIYMEEKKMQAELMKRNEEQNVIIKELNAILINQVTSKEPENVNSEG